MDLSETISHPKKTLWFTSIYTLFASIVVVAANLVTNIFVTRMLGAKGYGNFALITTTGLVLMVVLGQSLSTGLAYVVSRGRPALGSLALQLVVIGIIQFILAFGLLWGVQKTMISTAFLPPGSDSTVLVLAALLPVLQNLGEYWRIILISRHEAIKANQVVMVQRLLQVGLILFLAGFYFFGGIQFTYIFVVGLVVFSFILMNGLYIKYLTPMFVNGGSQIKEIFVFSIPVYLGDLFKALNYRMDVFFVSYFQNQTDLGYYAVSVGMANLILLVANAFATNLLPRVASSNESNEENGIRTAQIVRIIFWFNLFCAIGLGSISFWLLPFLYGEVFIKSFPALLLILPGTWLLSLTFVLASYINGIGKPRVNLYISMFSLAATLVLDISLIPRYSIAGAAIASTIAYSIGAVISMVYFLHQTGLPLTALFVLNRQDFQQILLLVDRIKSRLPGSNS